MEAIRRDFVANVSHELKTPVGALSLLAETLDGEDDPEVVERLAKRVAAEAERLGRIIDDLLDLSRIEANESPRREMVPLTVIVGQAVELLRPVAASSDVRLEVDDPPRHLAVPGDRRDLVSAVSNLVDNAIKYSERGSLVQVRVSADNDVGGDRGHRPGRGHPGARPGAHLRALLPGRPGPVPLDGRHRAGPVDRPPRRRQPFRVGAGRVPGGRRVDVHPAPAGPQPGAAGAGRFRSGGH